MSKVYYIIIEKKCISTNVKKRIKMLRLKNTGKYSRCDSGLLSNYINQWILRKRRCLSSKKDDDELKKDQGNVVLADALNLLSPKPQVQNHINYKPSLLYALTTGGGLDKTKLEPYLKYDMPESSVNEHLEKLVSGISVVYQKDIGKVSHKSLSLPYRELKSLIWSIKDENELIELVRLFYGQNKLTAKIMLHVIMNKNLQDLRKLPFDLQSINSVTFPSWKEIDFIHINVAMLKKYYDLKEPLLIIRNLRKNFHVRYLPMIKEAKLSPFYERIVWKFYFEYTSTLDPESCNDEAHYIRALDSLKSSFLIWESSLAKSSVIAKLILHSYQSKMHPLQMFLLRLSSCRLVEKLDKPHLVNGHMRHVSLLSCLKKISIKHKIYALPKDDNKMSVEARASCYAIINSLEGLLANYLRNSTSFLPENPYVELQSIYETIKIYKETVLLKSDYFSNSTDAQIDPENLISFFN